MQIGLRIDFQINKGEKKLNFLVNFSMLIKKMISKIALLNFLSILAILNFFKVREMQNQVRFLNRIFIITGV
jgi:hypothetical protein